MGNQVLHVDDNEEYEEATRLNEEQRGSDSHQPRKIDINYIEDKSRRGITFSKRKAGIMKKAYELSTLTGTEILLIVVSENGSVYSYSSDKLGRFVNEDDGKNFIASCLWAPETPLTPVDQVYEQKKMMRVTNEFKTTNDYERARHAPNRSRHSSSTAGKMAIPDTTPQFSLPPPHIQPSSSSLHYAPTETQSNYADQLPDQSMYK